MSKALFLLGIALLGATANAARPFVPKPDGRIVGGQDADIRNFPHQVSVRMLGSHMCGGSIIRSNVIATAAHCILIQMASLFSVQYGVSEIGGSSNVIQASRLIRHELYDADTINHDVALIVLSQNIPFSDVAQPIGLAERSPVAGSEAVVTGWGALEEEGASPKTLQEVTVEVVSREQCKAEYEELNEITDKMLCAGVPQGGKDACQGDSGGPLVVDGILVGIVSWGMGCARADYSGVYSDVAALRDWIDQNSP